MNILLTGGCGYIGSHTAVELLANNHNVIVVDNLSNSSARVVALIEQISNKRVIFRRLDCANKYAMVKVIGNYHVDAVIHFAGLKSVSESVAQPLKYYRNNIDTLLSVCEAMQDSGVKQLVFSSSATVYGVPQRLPLTEDCRVGSGITNPYGRTKFMAEQILQDLSASDPSLQIAVLRYFNPIGAHPSGLIGESPNGMPNNLVPYVSQVASGKFKKLFVYGNDFNTPDGTGIRDYIHVTDLAKGHVAALNHLKQGTATYNLGTGQGFSVLEVIASFERSVGKAIPYEIVARRNGDVAACYADCSKAFNELGWRATKTVDEACIDAWNWQSKHPDGFAKSKHSKSTERAH